MIDLNPPAYSKLWEITKRVQTMRESNGPGPGDFIDRINELNKRVINGEFPSLSSDQVTGQVFGIRIGEKYTFYFQGIAFIAAGFETTSNTLTTLCLNLAENPEILETLLEEVDDMLDRFEGVVNHETISDMPYLDACIKVKN